MWKNARCNSLTVLPQANSRFLFRIRYEPRQGSTRWDRKESRIPPPQRIRESLEARFYFPVPKHSAKGHFWYRLLFLFEFEAPSLLALFPSNHSLFCLKRDEKAVAVDQKNVDSKCGTVYIFTLQVGKRPMSQLDLSIFYWPGIIRIGPFSAVSAFQ